VSYLPARFLGITVLSDFVLSEGPDTVLDQLQRAGATAVACNPTVTAPGSEANGSWQPPADAGASVRLFDRPLWGRRELWVRSGPSFEPDPSLYRESPYAPRKPNDLTRSSAPVIRRFVRAAKERGLKVYFQVGAVQPPGLRPEDTPRLPDGSFSRERMADTGSLASPAIRAYNRAYARDLFRNYPEIDGLRVDWPEYPCYKLDEAFQDFGEPVRAWAKEHGFAFAAIQESVLGLYRRLHGSLTNADVEGLASADRGKHLLLETSLRSPELLEWLRLKSALSTDLLRDWREAVLEAGGPDKELSANAFMPPLSFLTGLDFAAAAGHAHSISAKLYTMHWALMVRFWGETLMAHNPGLDEALLVRALVHALDLTDDRPAGGTLAAYAYPPPDQPHPIGDGPQLRKIDQAYRMVAGQAPLYALVHGYGPEEDFRRRLRLALRSRADGVWINRYGYLSDAKLDVIAEEARFAAARRAGPADPSANG
jgi:hypothetical protein